MKSISHDVQAIAGTFALVATPEDRYVRIAIADTRGESRLTLSEQNFKPLQVLFSDTPDRATFDTGGLFIDRESGIEIIGNDRYVHINANSTGDELPKNMSVTVVTGGASSRIRTLGKGNVHSPTQYLDESF